MLPQAKRRGKDAINNDRRSDLHKTYHMGDVDVNALQGVSFTIQRGEFVAIMGPSGSGKSTLMNLIGCLDTPTSGSYVLDGAEVADLTGDDLSAVRATQAGLCVPAVHAAAAPIGAAQCRDAADLSRRQRGRAARRADDRAADRGHGASAWTTSRMSYRAGSSSAWRSRAPWWAARPCCWPMSRPARSTPRPASRLWRILQRLNREQGLTVVLVTHEPEIASYAQRVLTMRDGVLVSDVQS